MDIAFTNCFELGTLNTENSTLFSLNELEVSWRPIFKIFLNDLKKDHFFEGRNKNSWTKIDKHGSVININSNNASFFETNGFFHYHLGELSSNIEELKYNVPKHIIKNEGKFQLKKEKFHTFNRDGYVCELLVHYTIKNNTVLILAVSKHSCWNYLEKIIF